MASRRSKSEHQIIFSAIDKVAAPVRAINNQIESMVRPIRKIGRELKAVSDQAGFARLGSAAGGALREIAKLGAVGGAALTGLFLATKGAAAQADHIAKMSRQVGLAASSYQELKFAYEQAGVKAETFDSSVGAFTKRLGELKAGSGALYTIFKKVNPEFGRMLAQTTSTEEALRLMNEELARQPNEAQRSALAAAAFSRAGLSMGLAAELGSDELERLRQQAREYGLVLDDNALASSEKMTDQLNLLSRQFQGMKNTILSDLFPVIAEYGNKLQEWIGQNRELIQTKVGDFLRELVSGLKKTWEFLEKVGPPASEFLEAIGGMKTILAGLGALVFSPLAIAIGAVIVALGTPVGLIAAAVIAIGLAISQIIVHWDKLVALFDRIPEPLRNLIGWGYSHSPLALAAAGIGSLFSDSAPAPVPAAPASSGGGPPNRVRIELDHQQRFLGAEIEGDLEAELADAGLVGAGL